jgi:predicted PurR-regulated permease PerM
MWFRHRSRGAHPGEPTAARVHEAPTSVIQIDADQLSRVFSAPRWLRDLGFLAWFLVGVVLVLAGAVWLMAITWVILGPVLVGAILSTVAGPLVSTMQRHGIGRAAGSVVVLLGMAVLAVAVTLIVFRGLYQESDQIKTGLSNAVDKIEGWANDHGIHGTSSSTESAKSSTEDAGQALLQGLRTGISGLTSFIFFITFSAFSTFFLLKDGPTVRRFIDRHLGVPTTVATTITGNVIRSLRSYFLGLTIVAAFNAVVVGLAAWLLDVPLAGTIAVVTFVLAYIPYIGAFVAGAFAVLLALTESPTDAIIMLIVVILANGLLQNLVQPIAFGATLDLSPLVALIASVGAGAIFGMPGLILGAPLTSAAVHITRDLAAARARASVKDSEQRGPPPAAEPAPSS